MPKGILCISFTVIIEVVVTLRSRTWRRTNSKLAPQLITLLQANWYFRLSSSKLFAHKCTWTVLFVWLRKFVEHNVEWLINYRPQKNLWLLYQFVTLNKSEKMPHHQYSCRSREFNKTTTKRRLIKCEYLPSSRSVFGQVKLCLIKSQLLSPVNDQIYCFRKFLQ